MVVCGHDFIEMMDARETGVQSFLLLAVWLQQGQQVDYWVAVGVIGQQ